jgi:hypothetical protein
MFKVNPVFLLANSLLGLSLILLPKIASAETLNSPILIAQNVVDGLPPAPPQSTEYSPESNLQTPAISVPDRVPNQAPDLFELPARGRPVEAAERYLVIVNGSSPRLLTQVRRIESDAFIQEYQGQQVIQIGLFNDVNNAQDQVDILAAEGINAEIWQVSGAQAANPRLNAGGTAIPAPDLVPVAPIPASVSIPVPAPMNAFSFQPASVSPTPLVADTVTAAPTEISQDSGSEGGGERTPYYVVIPGDSDTIPEIANQVIRLGDGYAIASMVEEAARPLGQHVRVGPFTSRRSASRWSRYFRNFGMDARIDYRR